MRDDPIYLDYNATTPLLDEVAEAMQPYLGEQVGNPSSGHPYGERAERAVEEARRRVAELIEATPREIIFTSGGTESNNLALRGVCRAADQTGAIATSAIEHPAVAATCNHLASMGWEVARVGVDAEGRLDVEAFRRAVDEQTELVTVMHANNETGVLQPIDTCASIADRSGALVHTDAAQTVGKVPIDVDELGVDLLTIAGHKLYAPKGIGALYVREGTPLEPILFGASHEGGLRPGTEAVSTIVGLGKACEVARHTLEEAMGRVERLRDRLWTNLRDGIPGIALNGAPDERLPNTLNVRFPEVRGDQLLANTPQIAASTGSACHEEGAVEASTVIEAMGVDTREALGSVRLTLGRQTTGEQIGRVASALVEAWQELTE
jgi:cysteine desulfurase